MPISPATSLPAQGFLPLQTAVSDGQTNLAPQTAGRTAPAANATNAAPGESRDTTDGVQVTLKAGQFAQRNDPVSAPAYAEIWKDGIKVAVIDTHGGVKSVNGLVPSAQGIPGNGGALLAARRVAEIAQSVGGEVRVGGQVMDSQTLGIRTKLAMAYNI
jgi:hypothetical protein